jgi:hypothetical protein
MILVHTLARELARYIRTQKNNLYVFFIHLFDELQEHNGLTARATTDQVGTEVTTEEKIPHGNAPEGP